MADPNSSINLDHLVQKFNQMAAGSGDQYQKAIEKMAQADPSDVKAFTDFQIESAQYSLSAKLGSQGMQSVMSGLKDLVAKFQ